MKEKAGMIICSEIVGLYPPDKVKDSFLRDGVFNIDGERIVFRLWFKQEEYDDIMKLKLGDIIVIHCDGLQQIEQTDGYTYKRCINSRFAGLRNK